MPRIADNNKRTKHAGEIVFFNALIIDLRKWAIHHPNTAEFCAKITMERLDEATQMLTKLEQCKEQVNWK